MRSIFTFLLLCLLAFAAPMLAACATEEDYPLAIPDTSDGDDQVIIPLDVLDKSHLLTPYEAALTHCNGLQQAHFNRNCANTYQNYTWLTNAQNSCQSWVDSMTPDCHDEFAKWMYWSYNRGTIYDTTPPYDPPREYGDAYRWTCENGWPYLTTPNDTDALRADYYACDPLY